MSATKFAIDRRVRSVSGGWQCGLGMDKQSIEAFEEDLKVPYRFNRMSSGLPPPVKAVAIPKKNGGCAMGVPIGRSRGADGGEAGDEPELEARFLRTLRVSSRKVGAEGRSVTSALLAVSLGAGIRYQGPVRPYRPRAAPAGA